MSANRALTTVGRTRPSMKRSKKAPEVFWPLIGDRRAARERAAETGANFPVGGKKVYLPSFQIELQYNPRLTPMQAQFEVPLNFSKLDLKDLLWHAYNVRTHQIRSWVTATRPTPVPRGSLKDLPGKQRTYLPLPKKKMIVFLDSPFVWPNAPDFEQGQTMGKADKLLSQAQKEQREAMTSSEVRRHNRGVESHNVTAAMAKRFTQYVDGKREWVRGVEAEGAANEGAPTDIKSKSGKEGRSEMYRAGRESRPVPAGAVDPIEGEAEDVYKNGEIDEPAPVTSRKKGEVLTQMALLGIEDPSDSTRVRRRSAGKQKKVVEL